MTSIYHGMNRLQNIQEHTYYKIVAFFFFLPLQTVQKRQHPTEYVDICWCFHSRNRFLKMTLLEECSLKIIMKLLGDFLDSINIKFFPKNI